MTSPFGKLAGPASSPAPPPVYAPTPPPASAPPPPAHSAPPPVATTAAGGDVGAAAQALLLPGERIDASITLRAGDITVTDQRVVVQQRSYGFFGLVTTRRITHVIRRRGSSSVAFGTLMDLRQLFAGTCLTIVGLGALGWMASVGRNTQEASGVVGLTLLVLGIALLATAKRGALVIGTEGGPHRVALEVLSGERGKAERFFQQVAPLLAS